MTMFDTTERMLFAQDLPDCGGAHISVYKKGNEARGVEGELQTPEVVIQVKTQKLSRTVVPSLATAGAAIWHIRGRDTQWKRLDLQEIPDDFQDEQLLLDRVSQAFINVIEETAQVTGTSWSNVVEDQTNLRHAFNAAVSRCEEQPLKP